jgi:hypothetical protein
VWQPCRSVIFISVFGTKTSGVEEEEEEEEEDEDEEEEDDEEEEVQSIFLRNTE